MKNKNGNIEKFQLAGTGALFFKHHSQRNGSHHHRHFSLPFQPPSHASPDQPNQHLLLLSNQLTASPTLIALRASLMKLAVLPSYHLCLGGPKYLCVHLLDWGAYISGMRWYGTSYTGHTASIYPKPALLYVS
jgi:hypothetical protein